jgi:hypothetical protein
MTSPTLTESLLDRPTDSADPDLARRLGPVACSTPDRLRWIADFLDLADKAICVIACVQELDYPPDMPGAAQRDLRACAQWLDGRPTVTADLDAARAVLGAEDRGRAPRCGRCSAGSKKTS